MTLFPPSLSTINLSPPPQDDCSAKIDCPVVRVTGATTGDCDGEYRVDTSRPGVNILCFDSFLTRGEGAGFFPPREGRKI